MIKDLLVVVVSLCSVVVGAKYKSYYKRRADLWDELYRFSIYAKDEISFKKTYIDEIYHSFNLSEEFLKIKSGEYEGLPFDDEEIRWICGYFKSLGKSGLDGEIENATRYVSQIEEKRKISIKNNEEKGKISLKLGILFGIGVFVILI